MSGQDLIIEISKLVKHLNAAQVAFKQHGQDLAQAERDYDVAFAKALLEEKDKYPATIVEKIVKGREDIANLKMELNIKETLYKAADKAIDSYKKRITVLNDQIQREWKG